MVPTQKSGFVILFFGHWVSIEAGRGDERDAAVHALIECQTSARDARLLAIERRPTWLLLGDWPTDRDLGMIVTAVREVVPTVLIAVLGPWNDVDRWQRWMQRGVQVYLTTDATPNRVVALLRVATEMGVTITDQTFPRQLALRAAETRATVMPSGAQLTPREYGVLDLVRHGVSNSDIAKALRISESTVEFHLTHILDK